MAAANPVAPPYQRGCCNEAGNRGSNTPRCSSVAHRARALRACFAAIWARRLVHTITAVPCETAGSRSLESAQGVPRVCLDSDLHAFRRPPPAPRRYAACGTLGRPAACCERTRRECVRLGHCHTHHGLRSGRRGRRGRSLIRRCHGRGGAAPDEQPRVLQGARRAGGGGDRTGGGEVPQLCAGPRQLRGDRRRAARAGESPLPPSPAALPLLAPNSLGGHRACCRLYKPF